MTFLLVVIYVAFIGLGLPDTILGAAWPLMQVDLNAPLSAAGILSIIVSIGTIVSSLITPTLLRMLGTGKLVALSIACTMVAAEFGIPVDKMTRRMKIAEKILRIRMFPCVRLFAFPE